MGSLRRLRLNTPINEASALFPVHSPKLLSQLATDRAWWIAHDEADLRAMVSVVYSRQDMGQQSDDSWQATTLHLTALKNDSVQTDAEALAFANGFVFVFGSSFIGPKGILDDRRSFVARFSEHEVSATADGMKGRSKKSKKVEKQKLSAQASVLDLGTHLTRSINGAINAQKLQVLKPHNEVAKQIRKSIKAGADLDPDTRPINIEGAAFIGDDLVLGLRWPVSSEGQPLVARISDARPLLLSAHWSAEALAACPTSVHSVDVDGTPKRPAGIRGMTVKSEEAGPMLHLIAGPTERELADTKVRSAPYQHLRAHFESDPGKLIQTEQLQTFEGYRKVEAVAPFVQADRVDGWIYALDDEDAVVLLIQD